MLTPGNFPGAQRKPVARGLEGGTVLFWTKSCPLPVPTVKPWPQRLECGCSRTRASAEAKTRLSGSGLVPSGWCTYGKEEEKGTRHTEGQLCEDTGRGRGAEKPRGEASGRARPAHTARGLAASGLRRYIPFA